MSPKRAGRLTAVLLSVLSLSCFVAKEPDVRELERIAGTRVESPVKVHTTDGGTAVFPSGAVVTSDSVIGAGTLYTATLVEVGPVRAVSLETVVGMEVFETRTDGARTLAYGAGTVGAVALGVIAFKAIFGSCPTIYSDSAGTWVLEAESFTASITPLLERRDVDRLRGRPDADGVLRLDVRNEALETHYIEALDLVEVTHNVDEVVYPGSHGPPVAARGARPATRALDRGGRDVRRYLAEGDQASFASSTRTIAAATDEDPRDWIDLTLPNPGTDSVAVLLRVQASLLSTLLLYDHMLARPGAHAADWLATDMQKISTVARFGRWFRNQHTLRVQVADGDRFDTVARLADIGPIAPRDVAVMVPVDPDADSVRVRLEFFADQWRIDRVLFAGEARRVEGRVIEPHVIREPDGEPRGDVLRQVAGRDGRYVMTRPSEHFIIEYRTDATAAPGRERTYLFGAQGYYTEWLRGSWLRESEAEGPFDPADLRPTELLREWLERREDMEESFFASKIPVA